MVDTVYDLDKMDPNTFEHITNAIALQVLGAGHSTFGPGADGGRDGLFEGEAPYPSVSDRWSGIWYIQSKYHKPGLSTDHNKWLIRQVKEEIDAFSRSGSDRQWPDNWIIATNVDPSATPKTGAYDTIIGMVKKANPKLAKHTHIWGGNKIAEFLNEYDRIARRYGSFITPGDVLAELRSNLTDRSATLSDVVRYLTVTRFVDQQFTKLEQAGSSSDNRPGIQKLFRDIPFSYHDGTRRGMASRALTKAMAQNHAPDQQIEAAEWREWQRSPTRARVWFIKGGPGQGKSTVTQYFCQIQRAAILSSDKSISTTPVMRSTITEIRRIAQQDGLWPELPRVPVSLELKEYAQWLSNQKSGPHGVLAYIASLIEANTSQDVLIGTLKRAFAWSRWLFVFDGMDEVPGDVKDQIAREITYFVDDVLIGCECDAQIICTSRPQGYSGQFDALDAADIRLIELSPDQALACAKPILEIDRSPREAEDFFEILKDAITSQSIREIMTTPLQAHIMAVVVRGGGRPPERRWELFSNFYNVINKREMDKSADKNLSKLLRSNGRLVKTLHNRLGFALHSRAEESDGAQTSLKRDDLEKMIESTVDEFKAENKAQTILTLKLATTDRLVLVNTPENGEAVRFDIRPLQEFFAAEYMYETAAYEGLPDRVRAIAADSHWREVVHFLISALIENNRQAELAQVVRVLSEIDDPDVEALRPLSRRLSIGAHVVARLLEEGVLEEDQRTRHSFKSCLIPIFGTTDAADRISSTDREDSLSWTLDIIAEVLRDRVEPENVGAASAALEMVSEDSRQAKDIEELILASSMEYLTCLLRGLKDIHSSHLGRKVLPSWGIKVVLKVLMKDRWFELSNEALSAAFSVLNSNTTEDVAAKLGLSRQASETVRHLFKGYGDDRGVKGEETFEFGLVNTMLIMPPEEITRGLNDEAVLAELACFGGMISSIAELVNRANRNFADDERLLQLVGGAPENLIKLPPQAHAYLCDNLEDLVRSDSATELSSLIRREKPQLLRSFSFFGPNNQQKDWVGLARAFPDVILHFVGLESRSAMRREIGPFLQSTEAINALLATLQERPRAVLGSIGAWGTIIKAMPAYEDHLRGLMVEAASGDIMPSGYMSNSSPFKIKLPLEAEVLPHLIQPLILTALDARLNRLGGRRAASRKKGMSSRIRSHVAEYGLMKKDLALVKDDPAQSQRVRAAAHVLFQMSHVSPKGIKAEEVRALGSRYMRDLSPWYLTAVGLVVNDAIEEDRKDIKEALSELLQAAREDYPSRLMMEPLIDRWREVTRSPVIASAPEIWQ